MDSLLTNLADELLVQDITEPSAILGALSGDELETAYDHVLEQFALELLVDARHDLQQRAFAGAVGAEHADLGAGIEREPDVIEDDARRRNHLAQSLHDVDELRCHCFAENLYLSVGQRFSR